MKLSWVFNLLPRLFPANDIQVTAAERGLLAFEALNEVHEPAADFPCVVEDCPERFESGDYATLNTHCYWEHLEPNPFKVSDDPRVTYMRYPGADSAGDFMWHGIKVTSPKESAASWCHTHHRSSDACASLHVDVPASSPLVVDKPSVSVVEPGTEGTSNLLDQIARVLCEESFPDNARLWSEVLSDETRELWRDHGRALLKHFNVNPK